MAPHPLLVQPIALELDLGTRRVNWNHARWQVVPLGPPLACAPDDALDLTVTTATPRTDVGVCIALQEAGGAWYVHPWACGLAAREQRATVALADFTPCAHAAPEGGSHVDDDGVLTTTGLRALAVGCVDPLGSGRVAFRLERCELLPGTPPRRAHLRCAGLPLTVNATRHVPPGIFGGFNLPAGHRERYRLGLDRRIHHQPVDAAPEAGSGPRIETIGDRVRPSTRLTHPDWRQRLGAVAQRFAAVEGELLLEFWNEPYLNWANRNRANFVPSLYDLPEASEGATARIAHDGVEVPHLRWTRRYEVPPWSWCSRRDWRRGRRADGSVVGGHAPPYAGMEPLYDDAWRPATHPPEELADGATYEVELAGERLELTATTPWQLYDETQFTHWSGAAMVPLYVEPLLALAEPLVAAKPDAVVIAGWGNRASEDHWAAWELLYRPTIDAAHHVIDGVCDHDYGGVPTRMDAVYETVCTYGVTRHGRWLHGWNTECANATDPQAVPAAAGEDGGASADWRKATWCARKILSALARVPDKARSQLHFGHGGPWFSEGGEGLVLDALRALRGRLVAVELDQPDLLAVAAIDGTDPRCARETGQPPYELCLAVVDTSGRERPLGLALTPPDGCRFASDASLRVLERDGRGAPRLRTIDATTAPAAADASATLAAHGFAVWRLPLEGTPRLLAGLARRQVFARPVLQPLDAGRAWRAELETGATTGSQRAWIRLAVEHLAADSYELVVDDRPAIPLPGVATALDSCDLVDIPLPTVPSGPRVAVEIRARHPGTMPALVCALSLWLEGPTSD